MYFFFFKSITIKNEIIHHLGCDCCHYFFLGKEKFTTKIDPEIRKKQLLEILYSKPMTYKIEKKFINMSPKIIELVENDIRFVPYADFLVRLNQYRNEKFPMSTNTCHQFLSNLFINSFLVLQQAVQNKTKFFTPSSNNKYYFKKDKYLQGNSDFTNLDYAFVTLFVENEPFKKEECQADDKFKTLDFDNMFKIIF